MLNGINHALFFEDHIFFGYIYELLGKIKISSITCRTMATHD